MILSQIIINVINTTDVAQELGYNILVLLRSIKILQQANSKKKSN